MKPSVSKILFHFTPISLLYKNDAFFLASLVPSSLPRVVYSLAQVAGLACLEQSSEGHGFHSSFIRGCGFPQKFTCQKLGPGEVQ